MVATRPEVYEAIDSERDYQNARWVGHRHSLTEYMVYINHYVQQTFSAVSTQDTEFGAVEPMRKIAALAVAAMEEHGCLKRVKV